MPVQRYLARRADPGTADDVLGDVLLALWRRIDDVPAEAGLPWSYAVARRCLANQVRGRQRHRRLVAPPDPGPARPAPADGDEPTCTPPWPRCRPADAEVLRLWAWEELAPREIAVVLGTTPNAVSIRLHRAKARLPGRARGERIRRGPDTSSSDREGGPPMDADDDLRRRLHDADPVRGNGSGVPQQSPRAHEILERAMRIADQHDPTTPPSPARGRGRPPPSRRPVPALVAVAAAAVVAVGAGRPCPVCSARRRDRFPCLDSRPHRGPRRRDGRPA